MQRPPLPDVHGPRLHHFSADSDQEHEPSIEFLEVIGSGLHGHVVKAKIDGRIYAVKIVSSMHSISKRVPANNCI